MRAYCLHLLLGPTAIHVAAPVCGLLHYLLRPPAASPPHARVLTTHLATATQRLLDAPACFHLPFITPACHPSCRLQHLPHSRICSEALRINLCLFHDLCVVLCAPPITLPPTLLSHPRVTFPPITPPLLDVTSPAPTITKVERVFWPRSHGPLRPSPARRLCRSLHCPLFERALP